MKILLATTNKHKLDEIRQILSGSAIMSLDDVPGGTDIASPVEDQETFKGNAILKARYYARKTGMTTLADDSGLEVDALNGEPGVRSARYSDVHGPRAEVDQANNRLLMKNLEGVSAEKRAARFVCAMALCQPNDAKPLVVVRGTVEGRIITPDQATDPNHPEQGRGHHGFGYDPLFWLPDRNRTTAELSREEKNAISHRGHAARRMREALVMSHID